MVSKSFDNSLSRACGAFAHEVDNVHLAAKVQECEQRIAALMWVLGVIRRGVEWQEDSPILRIIERAMSQEEAQGDTLGPNVTRMTFRRATPQAAYYPESDFA